MAFSMCKCTKRLREFLDCRVLLNMVKYWCEINNLFFLTRAYFHFGKNVRSNKHTCKDV